VVLNLLFLHAYPLLPDKNPSKKNGEAKGNEKGREEKGGNQIYLFGS